MKFGLDRFDSFVFRFSSDRRIENNNQIFFGFGSVQIFLPELSEQTEKPERTEINNQRKTEKP